MEMGVVIWWVEGNISSKYQLCYIYFSVSNIKTGQSREAFLK